jgi:hypothetical protein
MKITPDSLGRGNAMRCMSTLLAILLVVGSLAGLPLNTEESEGGEYSGPPPVGSETVILADEGGGDGVQEKPPPEEPRNVVLV